MYSLHAMSIYYLFNTCYRGIDLKIHKFLSFNNLSLCSINSSAKR